MDLRHGSGSSASLASHGGRGGNSRGGRGGGNRGRGGFGRDRGNDNGGHSGGNGDRPTCQLCGKEGHTVSKCYKRFDASFTGVSENKFASLATTSYGIDTNWYVDSGATDNITGDLEKLTMRDDYTANDQIHTTSGAGTEIHNIGQSIVHTPDRTIHLNNVLYAPSANKNLISVHRLHLTITLSWSFILISFLSRIKTRKEFFYEADVEGVFIPYSLPSRSKSMVPPSFLFLDGTVV
jgi:histone deacetylase 1/2